MSGVETIHYTESVSASRFNEIADHVDRTERAVGSIATQVDEDGKALANHARRILEWELESQKLEFRIEHLEEKVNECGKFKYEAIKKMAGLQRLGACAACLAVLDLIINFLQLGGVI